MDEGHDRIAKAHLLIARAHTMIEEGMGLIEEAKAQTFRQSPARRATPERIEITDDTRDEVFHLLRHSDMTMHEIAQEVGLRNGGRVSEILSGKR
jgi:hypothetical protein